MIKLLNPIQNEQVLEELNSVRPLHLLKRVRLSLDVSVLNSLPIESVKSIAGTLAKCTLNGAMLKRNVQSFRNVETFNYVKGASVEVWSTTFSQKVYKVVIIHSFAVMCDYFRWIKPPNGVTIQELTLNGVSTCDFVGTALRFRIDPIVPNDQTIGVYGFY